MVLQCSPTKAIAVYAALVTVIGLHFYVTHQQMEIDLQAQAVVPPLPPRAPCPVASNNVTAQLITTAGSVPVVANKRKALVEAPPKSEEVYAVIPRIIHQTWKNKQVPNKGLQDSWKQKNPNYEYRFYTDDDMLVYMKKHHPEMMSMYNRMLAIQRADLFRYVVLYDAGGVYADIDVSCSVPIDSWLRQTNDMYNVALMVGFEMLTGSRPDWYLWYARKFQMCQWTIASAPKHPALANVLETIMDVFATHTDDEVMKKGVMEVTGPGIWSDAVSRHLRETFNLTFGDKPLTADLLKESFVHIGTTLLLPMRAFSVNSGGYFPSGHNPDSVFVRHGFQGSWKGEERQLNSKYQKRGPKCRNEPDGGNVCVSVSNSKDDQGPLQLFDKDANTKMLAFAENDAPINVTYTTATKIPIRLHEYSITAAGDTPSRDPSEWMVYARHHGDWERIDAQKDLKFERKEKKTFKVSVDEDFSQYRFVFPVREALQIGAIAVS